MEKKQQYFFRQKKKPAQLSSSFGERKRFRKKQDRDSFHNVGHESKLVLLHEVAKVQKYRQLTKKDDF